MDTLIEQDFLFDKGSLIYGQFLVEVLETCPDTLINDANRFYPWSGDISKYVSVIVPEPLAVVLKLRFGKHLQIRPPQPTPEEIAEKKLSSMKIQKNRYYKKDFEFSYIDYADILKIKEIDVVDDLKMEELYKDFKKYSTKYPLPKLDEK